MPGQIRFTYGADFALPSQPYVAFDPVIARQPDFMILGGDQMYADFPTVIADTKAAYEDRYKVTWADPKLRSAMQQIPMFMQWDDHEIFQDWSSGPTGRYVNARIAFDEYQGHIEEILERLNHMTQRFDDLENRISGADGKIKNLRKVGLVKKLET